MGLASPVSVISFLGIKLNYFSLLIYLRYMLGVSRRLYFVCSELQSNL